MKVQKVVFRERMKCLNLKRGKEQQEKPLSKTLGREIEEAKSKRGSH